MEKGLEYGAAEEVKRPTGITVIAVLNILAGISLAPGVLLSPQRPPGTLIALLALNLFGVAISVALLMLQNWARWTVIVSYVVSVIRVASQVIALHGAADVLRVLLVSVYGVWAVWYLFRPRVKAAFASA